MLNLDCVLVQSGEALLLDCACRGEMAVRHRVCAEKWSSVKVRSPLSQGCNDIVEEGLAKDV